MNAQAETANDDNSDIQNDTGSGAAADESEEANRPFKDAAEAIAEHLHQPNLEDLDSMDPDRQQHEYQVLENLVDQVDNELVQREKSYQSALSRSSVDVLASCHDFRDNMMDVDSDGDSEVAHSSGLLGTGSKASKRARVGSESDVSRTCENTNAPVSAQTSHQSDEWNSELMAGSAASIFQEPVFSTSTTTTSGSHKQ